MQKISILDVPLSSNYASVASLSSYKAIFVRRFWNFQNILSVQQLWTTSSKLFDNFGFFLETFAFLLEAISFVVYQELIFENMTLKNNFLNQSILK